MSTLVHSRGEGVKIGQNLDHVVVECPLKELDSMQELTWKDAMKARLLRIDSQGNAKLHHFS